MKQTQEERTAKVKAELEALLRASAAPKAVHEVGKPGRKPLPALPAINGLSRYAVEKVTGVRRENGALKLRKLTHRHYRIIGLHLEGKSLEEITSALHVSFNTVSRVLNDPLSQAILKRVYSHREEEINGLAGKAIAATREALTGDQPIGVKLRGVDRFLKIRESLLSKEQGRESAEDVIARILSNANIVNSNVQINIGETSASTEQ